MKPKKIRAYEIQADRLLDLLKLSGPLNFGGLPKDARAVALERGHHYNDMYNTMYLFVESAEFDEVPIGEVVPVYRLVFERRAVPRDPVIENYIEFMERQRI